MEEEDVQKILLAFYLELADGTVQYARSCE